MSQSKPTSNPGAGNGSGTAGNGSLAKLLRFYNSMLKRNPLLTKCITSAVTGVLGDVIAQMSGSAPYNIRKTIAFFLFGFFGTGPITHRFYGLLSQLIPADEKGQLLRLLTERLLFAPAFLLLIFYSLPLLQGKGLEAAHAGVMAGYWPALKANWKVWTLLQYINLNYVPQEHRVLFANVVALFWNVYLSLKQTT